MRRVLFFICILGVFNACNKDNDKKVTATVVSKGGCFGNSWLVAIEDPDFSRHEFLRPSYLSSCVTCYNCSNAAYVELTGDLASPGTRIQFVYRETQISCLSSSEAPSHIRVTNLAKL